MLIFEDGLTKKVDIEDMLDWMTSEGFYLNLEAYVVGSSLRVGFWFKFILEDEVYESNKKEGYETYGKVYETAIKDVVRVIQKRKQSRNRGNQRTRKQS
jgi:hypothetical protein